MGRPMPKRKNRKPRRQHKKGPKNAQVSLLDDDENVAQKSPDVKFVNKLIEKAESLIDCFEYEAAQKFCQRAMDLEPNNARALETSAGLMLDVGEVDAAIQCLNKAVEIEPDSGHNKYLTLGQIHMGMEAVQNYKKGIEVMQNELDKKLSEAAANVDDSLKTDISCAHCSVAEIYMSDCCFEENAESECKLHISEALKVDPDNPEVYLCSANLKMVKDDKEAATEAVKKSLSLWLPKFQDIRDGKLELSEFDPVEVCPFSYDSRINTSKLLIELALYEEANDVLEGLLDENDEVVEVWHLLGWANYLHDEDNKDSARYYLNKAIEIAKKVDFDDEDLLKHVQELLDEIGTEEDLEKDDDDDVDNEWEDLSDDQMEN